MFSTIFCDAPAPWQMSLQDPATTICEKMDFFHDYLMINILIVCGIVFSLLIYIIIFFNEDVNKAAIKFNHNNTLEIIWTLLPAILLFFISIPSFEILYYNLANLTGSAFQQNVKIIGHQWYWSYESFHHEKDIDAFHDLDSFDAYMLPEDSLALGQLRLLETDTRLYIQSKTLTNLFITADDVLHSWAVPSFGIKVDACPGRISAATLFVKRPGVFYGQCSEICGINHGFMPIVVRVLI